MTAYSSRISPLALTLLVSSIWYVLAALLAAAASALDCCTAVGAVPSLLSK